MRRVGPAELRRGRCAFIRCCWERETGEERREEERRGDLPRTQTDNPARQRQEAEAANAIWEGQRVLCGVQVSATVARDSWLVLLC